MAEREIRADYDAESIVVYQAFGPHIALPALRQGRLVPPFSLNRMTWIKPSFLWLMARSNWGQKPGQEHILAVRITRAGWEEALAHAVLTDPYPGVYRDPDDWRQQLADAVVRVQWDPERSIRGENMPIRSIQVGLGRSIVERYVNDWTLEIRDDTPLVRKIHGLLRSGDVARARAQLPMERPYAVSAELARRLGM